MATVIVFGPTGNVGSVAARTAQEHGCKVILAMRDTQKAIPDLSQEQEQAGGFERVQADLSKPDTLTAAIEKTKATRAFIYVAHGTPDHMKASLSALKSAGIEFVVMLSSYTVYGDKKAFGPSDLISFIHAQVELALDEVFGKNNYVAVRPGGFATNLLRFKQGIVTGDVRIFGSHMKLDCITPGDMGRVAGTILAQGSKDGQQIVYLYGPQVYTQKDAIGVIGKVLGRDISITELDEKQARDNFMKEHMPPPVIDYMIRELSKPPGELNWTRASYEEGVKNVELYTGRPSTGLEKWVEQNRGIFNA